MLENICSDNIQGYGLQLTVQKHESIIADTFY